MNPYDLSALGMVAITPANTNLAKEVVAITINVGGVLEIMGFDDVIYTSAALPAGTYAVKAKQVRTGTTATGITGWFAKK